VALDVDYESTVSLIQSLNNNLLALGPEYSIFVLTLVFAVPLVKQNVTLLLASLYFYLPSILV
jgi:hypothetical protein